MVSPVARRRGAVLMLMLVCGFGTALFRPRSPSSAFLVPRRSAVIADWAHDGPRSEANPPCRRRAASGECIEQEEVEEAPERHAVDHHLEVPEANFFANQKALDCIQEGCSVEEAEEIQHKLERDEFRIKECIAQMQLSGELKEHPEKMEEIDWFNKFLNLSSTLRGQLEPTVTAIAFGHGQTGGFLNLRSPHPRLAHSA